MSHMEIWSRGAASRLKANEDAIPRVPVYGSSHGVGLGLDLSAGYAAVTGVGAVPAGGLVLGGIVCHTLADIVDTFNSWVWINL